MTVAQRKAERQLANRLGTVTGEGITWLGANEAGSAIALRVGEGAQRAQLHRGKSSDGVN